MTPQTIIFIGPQGSGKGTQITKLIEHLKKHDPAHGVVEIQTGKGFRDLAVGGSYTALRVKNLLDHGKMIPDFLTQSVVVGQLIDNLTDTSHIIMDGFPRNKAQAQFVDDLLAFYLREDLHIVYLDTPEDVVRKRMLERGRDDDTEASIDERLRLYREVTEPLIAHYKNHPHANMVVVDGAGTIDAVHEAILAGLELA